MTDGQYNIVERYTISDSDARLSSLHKLIKYLNRGDILDEEIIGKAAYFEFSGKYFVLYDSRKNPFAYIDYFAYQSRFVLGEAPAELGPRLTLVQTDHFNNKYSVDPKTGKPAFWLSPEKGWQRFEAPPSAAGQKWLELQSMIILHNGPGVSDQIGVDLPEEFYQAVKDYEIPYVYLSSGYLADWVKENFPLEEFLEKFPARPISLDDFEKAFLNPPGGPLEDNDGFDRNGWRLVSGEDSDEFRKKMFGDDGASPDEAFQQPIPELIFFTEIKDQPFIILPQRLIYQDRDGKTKQEILFYYFDPKIYFDRYFTTEVNDKNHPLYLDSQGSPVNRFFEKLLYRQTRDTGPLICLPLIEFDPNHEKRGYTTFDYDWSRDAHYMDRFLVAYAKFYEEIDQKMPFYKDRQKALEALVAGELEDISSLGRYPQACAPFAFSLQYYGYYRE